MIKSHEALSRRQILRAGLQGCVALSAGPLVSACHSDNNPAPTPVSNIANVGPLSVVPDSNGLLLPEGFSSRVIARTGETPVASSVYPWHGLPDGGATFALPDGGWIYASNSEEPSGTGGVGAVEFSADGDVVDAYSLLTGTTRNCAGGPTPWGTWLSCEEFSQGAVWETFPLERGQQPAVRRDALGIFSHEAAAVDPDTGIVYLTEDRTDGCFYRFIPAVSGDLSSGQLQAAVVDMVDSGNRALEGSVSWVDVPDPSAAVQSTRVQAQAAGASIFQRGEGCWFQGGVVYFTTTTDTIVWAFTPGASGDGPITQIYNRTDLYPADTSLNGIDNITVSDGGDVLVAEDSDDNQIQVLTPGGELLPLLQLTGHSIGNLPGELTGPAFDPSGTRLYFSSQRGTLADFQAQGRLIGVTFEISGPFLV
ncbi:MAG: DUF839 domain-containing protein [Gammaproteobacteria bacterium]|nr:DUF839 domain-containing protein [Gammaproteobacteria bacterium]